MCHVIDIDNLIFNVSQVKGTREILFEDLVSYRFFIEKSIPHLYIKVTKDALFRNLSSYGGLMTYDKPRITLTRDFSVVRDYSNKTLPPQIRDEYLKLVEEAVASN